MSEEYEQDSGAQAYTQPDHNEISQPRQAGQSDYDEALRDIGYGPSGRDMNDSGSQQGYSQQQDYGQSPGYNQQQGCYQESPGYNQQQGCYQESPGYNQQQGCYQEAPGYNQQQGYNQQPTGFGQPPYNRPPVKQKKDDIGFGIASMVLGILSILLFMTCVNYIMAIVAIIFAIVQLCTRKKKGMAITGIITAVVGILLSSLLWIGVFVFIQDGGANSGYDDYYYYYNTDDYSTWHNEEL